ncbi:serine/threonine-protein phosphatase 6 regulatory ankyrin repeat subunit B-like [Littorina saxatilis]|uniref:Uncharacterized protein n=1 Tax=Littorina saxatilis TaxID=31220 RepID=A0AAN9B421_9CAEN
MGSKEQDLHLAVRNGDKASVEKLLSSGTNINCFFYGWTPLQLAIDIGNQELAITLVEAGSNINFHDKNHKSPFEEAVLKTQAKVVEALLQKGVSGDIFLVKGETPLTYAVEKESLDLLKVLVQGRVDINKCNSKGRSALYLAAKNGDDDLVKALIAAMADINYTCREEGGYTPLIVAAANEHKSVTSLLAKQPGCELNYQDGDGWTALWHAYSNARDDICAVLLRAGASKNVPNGEERTVVQDATENEDEIMLEVFQKYNLMM